MCGKMCGIPHKMCGINVWNSTQNVWNECVEFCPGNVWNSAVYGRMSEFAENEINIK